MIRELIMIEAAVVFIVDLSGARETLLVWISRLMKRKVVELRPLTCSLCVAWWCGLAYGLIGGYGLIASVAIGAGCGMAARPMGDLMSVAADMVEAIVRLIDKLLTKI